MDASPSRPPAMRLDAASVAMTRKLGRPRPDDVRCPECGAIDWRRVGERVVATTAPDGTAELRHEFAEGGPWEWTCDACGYQVRATDRLDNALGRIQAGAAVGALALADAVTPRPWWQSTTVAASVSTLVVAGGLVAALAGAPSDPGGTVSPSAVVSVAAAPSGEVGARVELADVLVQDVVGDRAFWVADGGDRRLVVLDETRQADPAVVVRAGQRLRITGTARSAGAAGGDLDAADAAAVASVDSFVFADHVEILGQAP